MLTLTEFNLIYLFWIKITNNLVQSQHSHRPKQILVISHHGKFKVKLHTIVPGCVDKVAKIKTTKSIKREHAVPFC